MSTMSTNDQSQAAARRKRRAARRPSQRNCQIYERAMLDGESYETIAANCGVTRQRIAAIVARVEGWLADQPEHLLAQKMRVQCGRRWAAIFARAMESFDRSRQDRRTLKEHAARRKSGLACDQTPVVTITEQTVREQNGDPRFLAIATRVAERQDRFWTRAREAETKARDRGTTTDASAAASAGAIPIMTNDAVSRRFAYLPASLGDLAQLACGLVGAGCTPGSTQFEQRCAEAFRCLGFEVRQLGQGCGRVADCLAIAAAERFAVVIDAKVRRRGYTLGTDDRQFCEYATRHARELAQAGIERVYFAVVGHGFRQGDLDKLAGFMTGTPIRSVAFIEAEALMRLVNDSIATRRQFRLADVDKLLFGNKIIES